MSLERRKNDVGLTEEAQERPLTSEDDANGQVLAFESGSYRARVVHTFLKEGLRKDSKLVGYHKLSKSLSNMERIGGHLLDSADEFLWRALEDIDRRVLYYVWTRSVVIMGSFEGLGIGLPISRFFGGAATNARATIIVSPVLAFSN